MTARKLFAEALGACLLLAIVVGSGVMADNLAGGNDAIALLGNTLATACGLVVLILIFSPVSGAHFNPAVTAVLLARRELSVSLAAGYVAAQLIGAVIGVMLAHAMFDLDLLQASVKSRSGAGQLVGEMTATFALLLTILGVRNSKPDSVALAVGLIIAAGYWFTSSTSFANPAVTIARTLTDTFAGVRVADAPGFVLAQIAGATLAAIAARHLLCEELIEPRPQKRPPL